MVPVGKWRGVVVSTCMHGEGWYQLHQ
jgi:hypothetical protein